MINCRGISSKGKTKKFCTPCENFIGHAKYITQFGWGAKFRTPFENKLTPAKSLCTPCKIFADHAKHFVHPALFRTLCETLRGLRSNFAPLKPFRTVCENQETLVKMKNLSPISF